MDITERIQSRFHFALPADYLRFRSAGLLKNDRATGLSLSRFAWMTLEEIAGYRLLIDQIPSLVPFARTWGRDHFCWFVEPGGDSWVAECPRDSVIVEGVAPYFEAFVFRALLEEFWGTWIADVNEAARMFRDYANRVGGVMRPEWVAILADYASGTPFLTPQRGPAVISDDELRDTNARELRFAHLGEQFQQYLD